VHGKEKKAALREWPSMRMCGRVRQYVAAYRWIGLYTGIYTALGDLGLPGARSVAVGWTDSTGAMWLYGGYGWDKNR
jgi:hypothetical protein